MILARPFLCLTEAYSLLSEDHSENTLGLEHLKDLSSFDLVVRDGRRETDIRDFKVKILTWADSDKGFVKQVSPGGFSD